MTSETSPTGMLPDESVQPKWNDNRRDFGTALDKAVIVVLNHLTYSGVLLWTDWRDLEPFRFLRTLQGMRLMGENDKDLWDKCAAGDADAFTVLFRRHADAVFRYCLARCGSWHDAEELVSITFLEAWRQRSRLEPERDSVLPWLFGVATNANRNRARASRRHADFLSRLPHSDPGHGENEADHAEAVASRLDAERAVRRMLDATAGLNDGERDVVILCLMHGIGQEEAAKSLGIRIGAVKSRLYRARTKLADISQTLESHDQLDPRNIEARLS